MQMLAAATARNRNIIVGAVLVMIAPLRASCRSPVSCAGPFVARWAAVVDGLCRWVGGGGVYSVTEVQPLSSKLSLHQILFATNRRLQVNSQRKSVHLGLATIGIGLPIKQILRTEEA
jgi:hypothetical protein